MSEPVEFGLEFYKNMISQTMEENRQGGADDNSLAISRSILIGCAMLARSVDQACIDDEGHSIGEAINNLSLTIYEIGEDLNV